MTLAEVLMHGAAPIMAILRGVRPDEAAAVGQALVRSGVRLIEVPFNSPEPERSVAALVEAVGAEAAVGGGTVLSAEMADRLAAGGGRFMVAPNVDAAVIAHAAGRGLEAIPGFATPSEAFAALAAGAAHLKLFPAQSFGPAYLKALREVLPAGAPVWAVGGVDSHNLGAWLAAGARGAGIGGALYRPGDAPEIIEARAADIVAAWRAARA
jgi:2-dehydro-3-deoxyphosphogalactonate aldolase